MPFQRQRSPGPILACVLAAGIVLTGAGCSHITPLGPDEGPPAATPHPAGTPHPAAAPVAVLPPPQHLRSPFVLQAARIVPPLRTGGCPAGSTALTRAPGVCYRKLGTPVTITSASVSVVTSLPPGGQYGFLIALPAADLPAQEAITTTAADAHAGLDISAAGDTWLFPQVQRPFTGPLQIILPHRNQMLLLHRLLAPSG
jgi:hypothetical protein